LFNRSCAFTINFAASGEMIVDEDPRPTFAVMRVTITVAIGNLKFFPSVDAQRFQHTVHVSVALISVQRSSPEQPECVHQGMMQSESYAIKIQ
jgi:hypothetical protein